MRIEEEFGLNIKASEVNSENDFGDTVGKLFNIWLVNLRANTNINKA
jgi:hypothetical protein